LADREFDVVLFTSSIQLDHLALVADNLGIGARLFSALQEFTAIASVGPVMTASLEAAGVPVDIVPLHPKMAALAKAASDMAAGVLEQKRARSVVT
jgi:uroporphyrinogen-III synthase